MELKEQIDINRLPKHIAVIMDGNGRWAKERGQQRLFGHQAGVKAVHEVAEASAELGVKCLTIYTFSTENWNRPSDEVGGLMKLLGETTKKEWSTIMDNNIRLTAIGDLSRLPDEMRKLFCGAIEASKNNTGMILNVALNYSGRWDITEASCRMAQAVKEGRLELDDITEATFNSFLSTAALPEPELLIRTSGELRISNFLLWQLAYSEFYFTDKYWPDFGKEDLYEAIVNYQHRERRFGKTSEQVVK